LSSAKAGLDAIKRPVRPDQTKARMTSPSKQ
jgi:hypothetical protein